MWQVYCWIFVLRFLWDGHILFINFVALTEAKPHGHDQTQIMVATGYFWWWECSPSPTGQLSSALSWAAPSQSGTDQLTFTFLYRYMGIREVSFLTSRHQVVTLEKKTKDKKVPQLGSWNVSTMCPTINEHLQSISDCWISWPKNYKSAFTNKEVYWTLKIMQIGACYLVL